MEADSVVVSLRISGVHESAQVFTLPKVQTIRSLSLPEQSVSAGELKRKFSYLIDSPITSYHNARPQLLLGADNCHLGKALV